jgi:hypothetical protein
MGGNSAIQYSHRLIREIEVFDAPFPYFISQEVFDPGSCDAILSWLENDIPWRLAVKEGFFEQYEYSLNNSPAPPSCSWLLQPDTLAELRKRVEALLRVNLIDRINVSAHKLIPGQGIGIHIDNPQDPESAGETHRLVVSFNRDFQERNGGHLVFFNSHDTADIHRIFRPINNTGVCFELSGRSFHAVSDVQAGTRYTIVYSFWQS